MATPPNTHHSWPHCSSGTRHGAPVWIEVTIVIATLARVLIAAGLLWGGPLNRPNPLRAVGTLFTYLAGLVLSAALLVV